MTDTKTRVTIFQLAEAAEWLRANEGPDGEQEDMQIVAGWIDREVERRIKQSRIDRVARTGNISRRDARRFLELKGLI